MSPKKDEIIKMYNEVLVLNNENYDRAEMYKERWEEGLSLLEEKKRELGRAMELTNELRKDVAQLKAEMAKLVTKQDSTPDESTAINDEPMPLGSPSTININDSQPPEVPTTQVTRKDKKVPAPEAITVYGVKDYNIFQQAIVSNLTTVANL